MTQAGGSGPEDDPPLWRPKRHDEASVFLPQNLLREARRQRRLPDVSVPEVCLLDPDGDIVAGLVESGRTRRHPGWACYHTTLETFDLGEREVGVVGRAVGAPFAVLVAEQLGGVRLPPDRQRDQRRTDRPRTPAVLRRHRSRLAGRRHQPPLPAAVGVEPPAAAVGRRLSPDVFDELSQRVVVGATWTTDAPYRETASAIAAAEAAGIVAVEMEAAALYAFAEARGMDVVCLAHVTNTMAVHGNDFEKGKDDGVESSLARRQGRRRWRSLDDGLASIGCLGPSDDDVGVPGEVGGPAALVRDAVADAFPAGAVPVEVAVLELDPVSARRTRR